MVCLGCAHLYTPHSFDTSFSQPGVRLLHLPVRTTVSSSLGHCWTDVCHSLCVVTAGLLRFCLYIGVFILKGDPTQKAAAERNAKQMKA